MVGTHAGGMVISQSRRSRKWTLRHKLLKSCSCQAIAVLTTSIRRNTGSDSPRYVIAHSPGDELSFRTSLNQAPRNGGNSASLVNHRRRTRRLLFGNLLLDIAQPTTFKSHHRPPYRERKVISIDCCECVADRTLTSIRCV